MATPKAVAMAEQAARDKQQATLDRILKNVQKIMDKLGLEEDEQPEAELPGEVRRRMPEAPPEVEPATVKEVPAVQPDNTVDTKAAAERMKRPFGKK